MGPFGWAPAPSPNVAPGRDKEGRERLATAGPGPLAVGLATGASEEAKELDQRLSNGVGIRLLGTPKAGCRRGLKRSRASRDNIWGSAYGGPGVLTV
jgi:hypothetical protein